MKGKIEYRSLFQFLVFFLRKLMCARCLLNDKENFTRIGCNNSLCNFISIPCLFFFFLRKLMCIHCLLDNKKILNIYSLFGWRGE